MCLSVTLCFVAKRYIPQQMFQKTWIRGALLGTEGSTFNLLHLFGALKLPISEMCKLFSPFNGYTVRRLAVMSEKATRKSIAACTVVQPSTPQTYPFPWQQNTTGYLSFLLLYPVLLRVNFRTKWKIYKKMWDVRKLICSELVNYARSNRQE